jgi:hypothetical protein
MRVIHRRLPLEPPAAAAATAAAAVVLVTQWARSLPPPLSYPCAGKKTLRDVDAVESGLRSAERGRDKAERKLKVVEERYREVMGTREQLETQFEGQIMEWQVHGLARQPRAHASPATHRTAAPAALRQWGAQAHRHTRAQVSCRARAPLPHPPPA